MLQFFLIWLGSLLIPILGLIDAGGWSSMMAKIQHNVPIIHPTVPNADFTSLWRNLGSFDTQSRWASTGSGWSSGWGWP